MFKKLAITEQKIYVEPNQVRLDRQGIFVDFHEKTIDVTAIHRDHLGTYVITSEYRLNRCPKGHPSSDGDGLCDEYGCPYNR